MSRSSSSSKFSESRRAKIKGEGDREIRSFSRSESRRAKIEGRGRYVVSPLKGQWFLLSAVVATGAFLVISGIFHTYSSIDPSVIARSNENFHFSQVRNQFQNVVSGSQCTNLNANLREFTAMARKEMAERGYLLYINYSLSGCKVVRRGFMLASDRTIIVENVNANDIIPGVFVSNKTSDFLPDTFSLDADGTLPNGLISYWKLNEASGNRADSKGSSTLTSVNGVTSNTGKQSNAAQFTASGNQYLRVADSPALSVGDIDFTIAGWFYMDSKNAFRPLVWKGDDTGADTETEYGVFLHPSSDRFRFKIGNGATSATVDTTGLPAINTWYFILAWHDSAADTINIQVNNGAVSSVTTSIGSQDKAYDFQVGRVATLPHDGRIDELGFWKKVLTPQERSDLYNGGNGNTYNP